MSPHLHTSIRVIVAPYHAGTRDLRVGAGPRFVLENGLVDRLQAIGKAVTVHEIDPVDEFEGEIGRTFEVIRRVATAVRSAVQDGSFPIVLAGNCNTSVGVLAGLGLEGPSMIWFDAHSDLDAPDETVSGYFDGMGASIMIGESWKALAATVPGHRPLPLDKITYCGVRDLSDSQLQKLQKSSARVVFGDAVGPLVDFAGRLDQELDGASASRCLVHVDLDCLDTSIGQANEYAAAGGLHEKDLMRCFDVVIAKRQPVGLTVASFNPHLEGGKAIADVTVNAIVHLMSQMKNDF